VSHPPRRRVLAAAGAAALAGCLEGALGGSGSDGETASGRSDAAERTFTATPTDGRPPTAEGALPLPSAPGQLREAAVSGGPPKDGIPSIDEPKFVSADATDLDDGDVVFGVARDGVAKAYPQEILVSHEVCNDVLDGRPISVTYCPLTGTAMGFWRGGTTFGVSGRLVNNNLIMYDRASESWWPQVLATSIPGSWNESPGRSRLREFRVIWTTWGRWRERYPDTAVLSRDTGHARNYDDDPYGSYNPKGGYYDNGTTLFPRLNPDDRYHAKRVVVGARTPDGSAAFLKDGLRETGLLSGELREAPVVAVYDPGLDTAYAYHNPDGESFSYDEGTVVGPGGDAYDPDDLPLSPLLAFDAMWFAWSGFYPDTNVYE